MALFVRARVSDQSRRWMHLVVLCALPLALAACAIGPEASAPPTVLATPAARPTPSLAPSSPPTATPSPTADARTPFDGVWASQPLTRADMAAALERRGLSDDRLDEWFPDWDRIDYRRFDIGIGDGRWLQDEFGEGVPFGGTDDDIVLADADAVVTVDERLRCKVTYALTREGDELSVRVADDACTDPADLAIRTAIYEASSFRLVEAADWTPPTPSPGPSASAGAPTTPPVSTSSARQTRRPIGTVKGAPLGYLEYLPPGADQGPSPLLVFLHGSGESGDGSELLLGSLTSTGIPSLIGNDQWPDARPFIVLSPQHEDVPGSACTEATEIDAFLRFALKHYDVDPSRVYLTGLSCGAIGLWNYLAAHLDERVAAAVPIAGDGIGAVQLAGCDLGRVPIWAFHGSGDDSVPVRGDVYPVTALQACTDPAPVDARVKVYAGEGHDVWTQTYRSTRYDIYDWMLSHRR